MSRAKDSEEQGFYRIATSFYEKVKKRDPESEKALEGARQAARLSLYELKDYERSIDNLKHLVLYSKEPSERKSAQKQIAVIYFDNLVDYDKAIVEYNRLLQMQNTSFEEADFKIAIARAYYHQGQFFQAMSEATEVLRGSISSDQRFEMLLLAANIKLALKDYKGAAFQYTEIFEEYPERSKKEDIHLSLILTLEEQGEFKKAIDTLESMREWYPQKEYIDLRINKLEQRLKNAPKERLKK